MIYIFLLNVSLCISFDRVSGTSAVYYSSFPEGSRVAKEACFRKPAFAESCVGQEKWGAIGTNFFPMLMQHRWFHRGHSAAVSKICLWVTKSQQRYWPVDLSKPLWTADLVFTEQGNVGWDTTAILFLSGISKFQRISTSAQEKVHWEKQETWTWKGKLTWANTLNASGPILNTNDILLA